MEPTRVGNLQAKGIALNADRAPDPAKSDRVARELEGAFAKMLIGSMRQSGLGDDTLFPGAAGQYRDLYDQQLANMMVSGRGLGLQDAIRRQLGVETGAQPMTDNVAGNTPRALPPRIFSTTETLAVSPAETMETQVLAALSPTLSTQQSTDLPTELPVALQSDRVALPLALWRNAGQCVPASRVQPLTTVDANDVVSTGQPVEQAAPAATTAAARIGAYAPAECTPEEFVARIWPHAVKAARELGVPAKTLVAQAALETGWGRKTVRGAGGAEAHNLFGIKATGNWRGERVMAGTMEYAGGVTRRETAGFRAYGSPAESFNDYVSLLKNNPRYADAIRNGGDGHRFAQALQHAGYATDPQYAAKLSAIAEGPTMSRALARLEGTASDPSLRA